MARVVHRTLVLQREALRSYRLPVRRPSLPSVATRRSTLDRVTTDQRFSLQASPEQTTEGSPSTEQTPSPSALDIRVGKILSCERHPDADSLYVEQVDVGEETPRTICSGLVPYVEAAELLNAAVVVLCNLKARNLRGIKSHGMLLCASAKEDGRVVPLQPPVDAVVGDRVTIGDALGEAETENRVKKQKIWEKLQPLMKTDADGIATCDGVPLRVSSGPITCRTLANAPIS